MPDNAFCKLGGSQRSTKKVSESGGWSGEQIGCSGIGINLQESIDHTA